MKNAAALFIVCLSALLFAENVSDSIEGESNRISLGLPEVLVSENGKEIQNADDWFEIRRPEILSLFEDHVYGRAPEQGFDVEFNVQSIDSSAIAGLATRKVVSILLSGRGSKVKMDVLIYLPNHVKEPVPLFLGLNSYGNQIVSHEKNIPLAESWVRNKDAYGITQNAATEASRGVRSTRWPVEMIIANGFGLATVYAGDITPDTPDLFENGVHSLFTEQNSDLTEWGAVASWAWGLSRCMDYLVNDRRVDSRRVCVFGHSRRGKAALWAGAQDQRFAMVWSSCSGCAGAALSRRRVGESVEQINTSFPHWFCEKFKYYNNNEQALPVDQHMLIALIAPRPVYVSSATLDLWADPEGEFLAAKFADPVYRLLKTDGFGASRMPEPSQSVGSTIGYHIRQGRHDITPLDWKILIDFAKRHF